MEKRYVLYGCPVRVEIEDGLIRIVNDPSFRRMVGLHHEAATAALINEIKVDYRATFGKALAVTDDSFTVEIWGHLYFDCFLLKYRRVLSVIFLFGLYQRFCRSCEVIDCGERRKDPNRRIWDMLAPLRKWMGKWLHKINRLE